MAKKKPTAAEPSLERDVVEPLHLAWDALGLTTTNAAFERRWAEPTNDAFGKLWRGIDREIEEEVHNLLFTDIAGRELSRYGQTLFRQAYLLARLLDHIENHASEPANAEIARCAVMFYAGVHFGREKPDFWALYLPLRDATRRDKPALFPTKGAVAPSAPPKEAAEFAAAAWFGMDRLYGQQYLPKWRPNLSASALTEPDPFPSDLIYGARDLND
ncbi:TPA: hypothetical protein QDB14_002538 [Burkholderia vietnamiensis]|nr:hypothetical protein [Burkholderia vietnamiensis]HEP6274468.1 hypothetical protein [Burkholderia vietnamiensis]HEP6283967.1 hypothetical protein [Burkholderia vietnamiensis]HEP6309433.1 hypothetical protein [Burkholderia vietnamiensis]